MPSDQIDPIVLQELDSQSLFRIYTLPAKRIIDKLSPMSSHVDMYQKRWFWELLQNACDYNHDVKVQIEEIQNSFIFRHNGSPFTMNQAMNLILPDSDKDEKDSKDIIGRYGSGFLSTHVLSSEIKVTGILKTQTNEDYSFNFVLDRSAREEGEKTQLANSLQTSQQLFRNSLQRYVSESSEYQTEFRYNLQKHYHFLNPNESIKKGLSFFRKVIPYVFAFQPKLQEIHVKQADRDAYYRCGSRTDTEVITSIREFVKGKLQPEIGVCIRVANSEGVTAAVEVEGKNILPFIDELPKLFKVYPLIGTESFPFPCVLHSLDLVPTLERNAIELSENDEANRAALLNGTKAYSLLIQSLSKEEFRQFYNLGRIKAGIFEDRIQDWFKPKVSDQLKQKLLNLPIVITNSGTYANLGLIKIPVLENEYYEAYYRLIHDTKFTIPHESEVKQWRDVLNLSVFTELKFDFKALLGSIGVNGKSVREFLNIEFYDWLKRLIELMLLSGEKEMLYEKSIIPQQDNMLRPLKSELYWDNEISEELKNIFELISSSNYRSLLLHKSIEPLGTELLDKDKQKNEKDILDAIDKALQKASTDLNANFIEALRRILKWTEHWDDSQLRESMPWFATERPLLVMRTIATDENRDMAFRIIQSGHIDILAKLADSGLSSEVLNGLVQLSTSPESISQLLELQAISAELGYAEVESTLNELLEDKRDFEFKLQVGHFVEQLLKKLLVEEFPHYEITFIGKGPFDFKIINPLNDREFYIELKSTKESDDEGIKVAISQARHAVNFPERYALCVVKRPASQSEISLDFLSKNIKCVYQIGNDLKEIVERSNVVDMYIRSSGSIQLEIRDPSMKVIFDWKYIDKLSKSFGGLKEKISNQLG